ncbi:MAG TPA: AI-2E family transporter [Alphaproteobacteria bacterium]|nr:AI-2E family transporter [Alphaproteobacteria bacterium]
MHVGYRIGFWVALLVVALLALTFLGQVLMPFLAGLAVAYFLDPVVDRLERWGLSRTLATSLVTLLFLAVTALVLVFLVPVVIQQLSDLVARLPDYVARLRSDIMPAIEAWFAKLEPGELDRAQSVIATFSDRAAQFLVGLVGDVFRSGAAIINLIAFVVITPVVSFYLLRDWDYLVRRIDGWLPRLERDTIREQARKIDEALAAFVRGTGVICLILAAIYGIALTALGLDFGLVIGVAAGLISWIPYVGSLGGLFVAVGLAALQFQDLLHPGICAGIFVFGQILSDLVLTPKIIGHRVQLHPVWVVFAVLSGGALFGFVGVLVAVPAVAAIGVLARFGIERYLASPLYRGTGPDGGEGGPPS